MATSRAADTRVIGLNARTALEGEMAPAGAAAILSEPLLDAAQAAVLLGIPRSSVYAYAKRGELPHVKVGKHVKFIRGDLEGALAERRVGV
ncbi:MAG TPA: helix-turn-helix domain-containing protein [Solirubrobacteraceae bacterium]|nr:helix-turn-helix domain-containing protein [Solirubrobacteraceae bacterium]